MVFALPDPVLTALRRLNARGHQAYAVGGCVRDLLRGVTPHDYDICASCPPEETHACFADERVIDTGIKHGTVTVMLGDMPLEITTFRTDGAYADGRHPSAVTFTRNLAEDLKRRDYTVNAMAYHPQEGVIDLFGGQDDLKARVIRCVGDAETRLTEDALRILRAIRFSAQLDFAIAPDTADAMRKLCGRLSLVSRERVAEELLKTVQYPAAADVLRAFPEVFQAAMPDFPVDALFDGAAALNRLPGGDAVLGLAALLHCCDAGALQACLDSLKLSKALEGQTFQLALNAGSNFPASDAPLMLAELGQEQFRRLLLLQQACGVCTVAEAQQRTAAAQTAVKKKLPMTVHDLPITGNDLLALGLKGPAIGQTLTELQRMALRGELACEREAMLAWVRERIRSGLS